MNDIIHLLFDGHYGIYIPQMFAEQCSESTTNWKWGYKGLLNYTEARDILLYGPDHDHYWEVWQEVLEQALWIDDSGRAYRLYQDDDVWMIQKGYHLDESGNIVDSSTDEIIQEP